eukprot:3761851-Alexandrium_andersonii.AAC.1
MGPPSPPLPGFGPPELWASPACCWRFAPWPRPVPLAPVSRGAVWLVLGKRCTGWRVPAAVPCASPSQAC